MSAFSTCRNRSFTRALRGALMLGLVFLSACAPQGLDEPAVAPKPEPPAARLRVLGSAQDGGFPHAACSCERCEGARNGQIKRRLIASLALITTDGRAFLIDATPDIRDQLQLLRDLKPAPGRVDRAPLAGVFLTHAHLGHYTGLGFLGFEAIHTSGLPIYATPRMGAFLTQNGPWSQLVEIGNVRLETLVPAEAVEIEAGVRVSAHRVPHRDEFADTVGFLIRGPRRTVFYVPDTEPWRHWEKPLVEFLDEQQVDLAILDGTFYSMDELPGRDVTAIGHPLVADSIELLHDRVRDGRLEVYFTHFNHSNPILDRDGSRRAQIEALGFAILDDGLELAL